MSDINHIFFRFAIYLINSIRKDSPITEWCEVNMALRRYSNETREEYWERLWCAKFELLKEYKKKYNKLSFNSNEDLQIKFIGLSNWCTYQREKYHNNELLEHRYVLLSNFGFSFNPILDQWEEFYNELKSFKENHGHCDVGEKDERLSSWCSRQRNKRPELISSYQRKKLDEIGFNWLTRDEIWYEKLNRLKEYKKIYGNCDVPQAGKDGKYISLAHWVSGQRGRYNKGILSQERYRELRKIGFKFDILSNLWERKFQQLRAFHNKFGHFNVSINTKEYRSLGLWVLYHRYYKERLTPYRKERLDSIGFVWDRFEEHFNLRCEQFVEYKKKYNSNLPSVSNDFVLSHWCQHIRLQWRENKLTDEKLNILNEIGFDFAPIENLWDKRFRELEKFIKQNGHCLVSKSHKMEPLRRWIIAQRGRRYKMPEEKRKRLDDIGFNWKTKKDFWYERLEELKGYKKIFGNCNVPSRGVNGEYKTLGAWVSAQRMYNNQGILKQEFIDALNDIGFAFVILGEMWNKKFQQIKIYKKKHGDFNVPIDNEKYRSLGLWVRHHRYNKHKIPQDRIDKLDAIGFDWERSIGSDNSDKAFLENFYMLKKHVEKFGNCIPDSSMEKKLKLFCFYSRARWRNGKLSEERFNLLKEIGFDFTPENTIWNERFKEIEEYINKNGTSYVKGNRALRRLRRWADSQRNRKNKLPKERKKKLDKIGFDWHPIETE